MCIIFLEFGLGLLWYSSEFIKFSEFGLLFRPEIFLSSWIEHFIFLFSIFSQSKFITLCDPDIVQKGTKKILNQAFVLVSTLSRYGEVFKYLCIYDRTGLCILHVLHQVFACLMVSALSAHGEIQTDNLPPAGKTFHQLDVRSPWSCLLPNANAFAEVWSKTGQVLTQRSFSIDSLEKPPPLKNRKSSKKTRNYLMIFNCMKPWSYNLHNSFSLWGRTGKDNWHLTAVDMRPCPLSQVR